jgi:hypothetical protein
MTETRATIPEPALLSDDETFDLMVQAFIQGPIESCDRLPILRMFGQNELIFCLDMDNAGDVLRATGTAIRLSVEVQQRLQEHFARWLNGH